MEAAEEITTAIGNILFQRGYGIFTVNNDFISGLSCAGVRHMEATYATYPPIKTPSRGEALYAVEVCSFDGKAEKTFVATRADYEGWFPGFVDARAFLAAIQSCVSIEDLASCMRPDRDSYFRRFGTTAQPTNQNG
ncbi:MAG: hypothetical protein HGA90_07525 [Alphaproteobacteria bacterium]|nr:hypothetical protein [Alphaproteobacteria bacterium]